MLVIHQKRYLIFLAFQRVNIFPINFEGSDFRLKLDLEEKKKKKRF